MDDALADEILYGRDHDSLRIFISSKMNGTLDDERYATAKAITHLDGHHPWLWEADALVGVLHSVNECVKFARTSDGLVLLLADELSEVVSAEFAAAKERGAERYIYVKESDQDLPDDVKNFIEEERRSVVTRNFANTDELKTHVVDGLKRTQVRVHRQVQVQRLSELRARDA